MSYIFGMNKVVSNEQYLKAKSLFVSGSMGQIAIAKECGVSRTSIQNWMRTEGWSEQRDKMLVKADKAMMQKTEQNLIEAQEDYLSRQKKICEKADKLIDKLLDDPNVNTKQLQRLINALKGTSAVGGKATGYDAAVKAKNQSIGSNNTIVHGVVQVGMRPLGDAPKSINVTST